MKKGKSLILAALLMGCLTACASNPMTAMDYTIRALRQNEEHILNRFLYKVRRRKLEDI